jgi:hypothetical protein
MKEHFVEKQKGELPALLKTQAPIPQNPTAFQPFNKEFA